MKNNQHILELIKNLPRGSQNKVVKITGYSRSTISIYFRGLSKTNRKIEDAILYLWRIEQYRIKSQKDLINSQK